MPKVSLKGRKEKPLEPEVVDEPKTSTEEESETEYLRLIKTC